MTKAASGIGGSEREKPLHQMEDSTKSRTSNYNETVRANNKRYDSGGSGKKLPRGSAASRQYRKSSR
jgi:hypothetical protein